MDTAPIKSFIDAKGRLTAYPAKRKKQLFALLYLAEKIDAEKTYTEQEINDLLDEYTCFHDPATLRRELFTCGFLARKADGTAYWLTSEQPTAEALGI